jgi:beta-glucanase (GH16 family)
MTPKMIGCVVALGAILGVAGWSRAPSRPSHIDLSRYTLTFDETFDTLDVSPRGPGTRWIAHTPWNGDFGDAAFLDPQRDKPFKIDKGILQIEMRRGERGWESGLLSSGDQASKGFLQSGGYFEVRAKLPGGPGVWPAFWLGSNSIGGKPNPEIDVLEYYGQFPDLYRATTHIWQEGRSVAGTSYKIDVPRGSLENAFHTYGVSIDSHNVVFYLDRQEVARESSRPEYLQPMFLMIDLGAGGGWPIAGMKNPSIMYIDYVRAYALKPIESRRSAGGQ